MYRDHIIEHIEDQLKITLPLNRITESLYYNKRLIVDNKVMTEPRCWRITKVNRIMPNGINRITMYQTMFDAEKDYIEKDDNGNVIDFWADYFETNVQTKNDDTTNFIYGEISFSGAKSEIKLNGSYKKLTVDFFEEDNKIDHITGNWSFLIDDKPADVTLLTMEDSSDVNENQIKVKLRGDDELLGKTMIVKYKPIQGECNDLELEIAGL